MVNRNTRRRSNRSKPTRRSTARRARSAGRKVRRSTTRRARSTTRRARSAGRKARSTTRRARSAGRKASRRTARKGRKPSRVEVVDDILSSSLGLGDLMKEDEKGYRAQRVAKKDKYKKSDSSEGYGLDNFFGNKEEGKPQKVHKKKSKLNPKAEPFVPEKERKKSKRSNKGASPYNKFVKAQSPILKKENPGMKQSEIMKLIGKKWKEQKKK